MKIVGFCKCVLEVDERQCIRAHPGLAEQTEHGIMWMVKPSKQPQLDHVAQGLLQLNF